MDGGLGPPRAATPESADSGDSKDSLSVSRAQRRLWHGKRNAPSYANQLRSEANSIAAEILTEARGGTNYPRANVESS